MSKLHSPAGDESPACQRSPVLPQDLIFEILLRLPVRSLLQFMCVCKSWKTLISDSQFAKDHLRTSTADSNMTHQRLVSSVPYDRFKIEFFSVQSLFQNPSIPIKGLTCWMSHCFEILGSCNGLLCMHDPNEDNIILWNPSTRLRSKRMPNRVSLDDVTCHGFGYDHVNDKYKLFIVVDGERIYVTKIFNFSSNSWTVIQNFPCRNAYSRLGKFVSGTLNWITWGGVLNKDQWMVLFFDLGKESYGEVLLPDGGHDKDFISTLNVIRDCLCFCLLDSKKAHWALWLMKEYGVHESWTKLMIIPDIGSGWYYFSLDPLCISENGVVLLRTTPPKLVLYNSNDGRFDYPRIWDKLGLDVHVYHESLFSPQI
ncbi:F-box/kelch-repeat protein At3g23880-like [Abrus precatorius]|uniref:F-box/kelch-repeat protein At3g23880-like n=1 Tax=Abrus precatorius TaxID=3816 RepID=A0A8B8M842_ABRPR|nr:F-box/kelch-repeat protein At3g23880-like [Abrus precatorius]